MGYVYTTKAIQKVKPYLDAMVKSQTTLTWASKDARKLAYQLHNGLKAAEELKFSPYDTLRHKYRVSATNGKVIAQLKAALSIVEGQLDFDITDPFDIVQTIIRHKTVDFVLFFRMDFVEAETLELVKSWTNNNGYVVEQLDSGLRIIKSDGNI
jgi:hypothetical protein